LIAAWAFELTAMMKLTAKGRPGGLSDTEKSVITATCQRFIDEVLKSRFLPPIKPTQFNYPIDILGKWHGNSYRLVQRYGVISVVSRFEISAVFL
jgi:hypothetical protein